MKVETMIKLRDLGITQEYMSAILVNKLPKTGEEGCLYFWNFHVWYYGKAPDEPIKRWHDLGSVSDFDDGEPLDEMESDNE